MKHSAEPHQELPSKRTRNDITPQYMGITDRHGKPDDLPIVPSFQQMALGSHIDEVGNYFDTSDTVFKYEETLSRIDVGIKNKHAGVLWKWKGARPFDPACCYGAASSSRRDGARVGAPGSDKGRNGPTRKAKRTAKDQDVILTISATFYGPLAQLDAVGDYLKACEMYLQDPTRCLRNVEYRNPHRISSLDPTAPMTHDLVPSQSSLQEIPESKSDLLSCVECHTVFPEVAQPQALKVILHSHQLQALAFLIQRESGQIKNTTNLDIWRYNRADDGSVAYVNTITGESQLDKPHIFRGGILAEEMGLGKTLAMISLIAHDRSVPSTLLSEIGWMSSYNSVKATLVIVPLSLLAVWDLQLSQHVHLGTLKWTRYHTKKNRATCRADFKNTDIVLTTYGTLVSEWKQKRPEQSPILSSRWRRVILDEAHEIRNRKTSKHKAICSINAHSRWAITGTRIQNSINDFASLLEFLRVDPYGNTALFNEHIVELTKARAADVALERLKLLMLALLLRRSRHMTIQLPKRVNLVRRLDFTMGEETRYRSFESSTIECLDIAITASQSVGNAYANAVRKINSLRMLCSLGTYLIKAKRELSLLIPSREHSRSASPALLDSPETCRTLADAGSNTHSPPSSRMDNEEALSTSRASTPDTELVKFMPATLPHSTKISTLVSDIQELPSWTKAVVFSYRTSMLDLIADALGVASISALQYDGRLRDKDRAVALSRFKTDPNIQVILVSISCGAVGLDMTAASHVFLMEPQWNPAVEEQALSRVYRMGQTKEVTTARYIMNATFEEHVTKVQDKKKGLADLLLSNGQGTEKVAPGTQLRNWRSLLG